jgi:hypothetical protein
VAAFQGLAGLPLKFVESEGQFRGEPRQLANAMVR